MNLYFKFFVLILKRIFAKKRQKLTESCVSEFRVGFFDLDLNFHMNNGRFFSVMDLGRFDMLMRTGHFFRIFRSGYYPVVLSEAIVFKKSLNYGKIYHLKTHVESWDKNFFYITQKFYLKDQLVASANVRACFKKRGQKGLVTTSQLFDFIGEPYKDEQLSPLATKQIEIDNILLPRNMPNKID